MQRQSTKRGTDAVFGQANSFLFSWNKKKKRWGDRGGPGQKSDYRKVQIDKKLLCHFPPTLGKAGNNSARSAAVLKRFPTTSLQLAKRLNSAQLHSWTWIDEYSLWRQFTATRLEGLKWSWQSAPRRVLKENNQALCLVMNENVLSH